MIKRILCFSLVFVCFGAFSQNNVIFNKLSTNQINKIVDVIYKIEGGAKTKYPYGIMSVKTSNPRRVCFNTVSNNYIRWQKAGKTNEFLMFLSEKYCPPSVDPIGNKNWKNNIKFYLKNEKY
jgi:hypothetical protein